jgi:SAM-dependent methyltransferase
VPGRDHSEPSEFYTGLVAELYRLLRSSRPDADACARFVTSAREPALELGCGDGDPLIELRRRGLDVEGLDASADMLDRARTRAAAAGLDLTLHHATFESMDVGRRYRSIFFAGPTFNLLPDDDRAAQALARIAAHLTDDGRALIPLFVPPPVPPDRLGAATERVVDGATLRCTPIRSERDEIARTQTTVLRYERVTDAAVETLERPWVLHWYAPGRFRSLVAAAGLDVAAVLGPDGRPAPESAQQLAFVLTRLPQRLS